MGRVPNGPTQVFMGGSCVRFYAMVHELMHAVGFEHEQSRFDRDNYITIVWQNIPQNIHYAFYKGRAGTEGEMSSLMIITVSCTTTILLME